MISDGCLPRHIYSHFVAQTIIKEMRRMLNMPAFALWMLLLPLIAAGCTPKFNRKSQQELALQARPAPAGLALPVQDLTAQGGSATPGVTPHFRVTRVAIGGNIRRSQGNTPSGTAVHGGVRAIQ
jgi:hypothetical protein